MSSYKYSDEAESIFMLYEDNYTHLFNYLSNIDKLNFCMSSKRLMNTIGKSRTILRNFDLIINKHSLSKHFFSKQQLRDLSNIPFRNIDLDLECLTIKRRDKNIRFFQHFKSSVENLVIRNGKFREFAEFYEILGNTSQEWDRPMYLQSITFENCHLDCFNECVLPDIKTLRTLELNKCNDNIYKTLLNQTSFEKIAVKNNDWTWNGFPHEVFNEIVRKSNVKEMKFEGAGTGSYFDSDEFPFKILKLDTTMITFHWYVGIKTERVSFLKSQKSYLQDLTIHQLPNDFDGGRVLKFIFDHMNLKKFHYGKTALILDGKKQQVKRIEFSEIQIQSCFELVRQFPSITSICLKLSATDIASDEIEKVINPPTDLFKNILDFEVVDNSRYRGIFGVFLGLLKQLTNVRKLSFKTPDRNINVLLEYCLPYMNQVNEIYMTSTANRSKERFLTIKKLAPYINKISVDAQYLDEAKTLFGPSVTVDMIKNE
jgi:hypothetical protein